MTDKNLPSKRKTLIFGIDGGTWDVLQPLVDRGVMPYLAELQENGAWGELRSVVPVNSAAAWSSILTGLSPEKHGVLDFLAWHPQGKGRTAVNASWYPRPTILDLMGEAGQVLALKIPMTYPPWQINGQMVSGLPTPDDESAFTYPEDLARRLNPLVLRHSACRSWEVGDGNRYVILDQMEAAQRVFERMTEYLLEYGKPEICFVVARDVDEMQHFFWDTLSGNDKHGYLPRVEKYFSSIDQYLGKMLEWARKDARVILLSDHGFGPVEGVWHLNEWLRSRGFLCLKDEIKSTSGSKEITLGLRINYALKRRLCRNLKRFGFQTNWLTSSLDEIKMRSQRDTDLQRIDWEKTLAYVGNVGEEWLSIYINLEGREPQGSVRPDQYEKVRNDLILALENNDEPAILTVHKSEELFDRGDPGRTDIPDLVVETVSGAILSDFAIGTPKIYEKSQYRNGCHRRKGMFLLSGPDVIQSQGDVNLLDIPSTILGWQGIPVPKHFDGRLLHEFIDGLATEKQDYETKTTDTIPVSFSEEEETGVRKKLESLGYI